MDGSRIGLRLFCDVTDGLERPHNPSVRPPFVRPCADRLHACPWEALCRGNASASHVRPRRRAGPVAPVRTSPCPPASRRCQSPGPSRAIAADDFVQTRRSLLQGGRSIHVPCRLAVNARVKVWLDRIPASCRWDAGAFEAAAPDPQGDRETQTARGSPRPARQEPSASCSAPARPTARACAAGACSRFARACRRDRRSRGRNAPLLTAVTHAVAIGR